MQVYIGHSNKSDPGLALVEALASAGRPSFLLVQAPYEMLPGIADYLTKNMPDLPNLGTTGISYSDGRASDTSLTVIAFGSDVKGAAGVLTGLSKAPMEDIQGVYTAMREAEAGRGNTICLEFCPTNEEVTVTSLNAALERYEIPLVGGTIFDVPEGGTPRVMVNGRLYEDACGYAIIRNQSGRIRSYYENIYALNPDRPRHTATRVDTGIKALNELDGRPAADIYCEETGVRRDEIAANVLKQPLGRVVGDETFISSINRVERDGSIITYKTINENDSMSVLDILDYRKVNQETMKKIKGDFPHISLIWTVNCNSRDALFKNEGYINDFIHTLESTATHVGYVAGGEQYDHQHVNQTMVCAVFE